MPGFWGRLVCRLLLLFTSYEFVSGAAFKRVCYFTNWSCDLMVPEAHFYLSDLNPDLCTHVIYAFARVSPDPDHHLIPTRTDDQGEKGEKGRYVRFNEMKKQNPSLKTLLSVGGHLQANTGFVDVVKSERDRRQFAISSLTYIRTWGFDGLDVDWEYPGDPPETKHNFTLLLRELRAMFEAEAKASNRSRLLLSIAAGISQDTVEKAYEIKDISEAVDFINVMAYDIHGSWNHITGFNSPLYTRHSDPRFSPVLSVEWALSQWTTSGASRDKLVLGIAGYGVTFTLSNSSSTEVGALVSGPGRQGQYRLMRGQLAFYEICNLMRENATYEWDEQQRVPYVTDGDIWAGFDDPRSVRTKVRWAVEQKLGGVMFWSLDLDDFRGAHCNLGEFPLLTAMVSEVSRHVHDVTEPPIIWPPSTTTTTTTTPADVITPEVPFEPETTPEIVTPVPSTPSLQTSAPPTRRGPTSTTAAPGTTVVVDANATTPRGPQRPTTMIPLEGTTRRGPTSTRTPVSSEAPEVDQRPQTDVAETSTQPDHVFEFSTEAPTETTDTTANHYPDVIEHTTPAPKALATTGTVSVTTVTIQPVVTATTQSVTDDVTMETTLPPMTSETGLPDTTQNPVTSTPSEVTSTTLSMTSTPVPATSTTRVAPRGSTVPFPWLITPSDVTTTTPTKTTMQPPVSLPPVFPSSPTMVPGTQGKTALPTTAQPEQTATSSRAPITSPRGEGATVTARATTPTTTRRTTMPRTTVAPHTPITTEDNRVAPPESKTPSVVLPTRKPPTLKPALPGEEENLPDWVPPPGSESGQDKGGNSISSSKPKPDDNSGRRKKTRGNLLGAAGGAGSVSLRSSQMLAVLVAVFVIQRLILLRR